MFYEAVLHGSHVYIFFICRKDTASEDRKLIERIFPHFFLLNKLDTAWAKMYQKKIKEIRRARIRSLNFYFTCIYFFVVFMFAFKEHIASYNL